MKQMTLATAGFERYGKTTRRAEFLSEMDKVVPWSALCFFGGAQADKVKWRAQLGAGISG